MNKRFTASRVPDSGMEVLFATEERWQAWLDIESALALTQADLEMIPREAADAITAACRIERLDLGSIREGIARTSHPLMPLIVELSRVVGEPHGGWVHWGATTQNITQTGDAVPQSGARIRGFTGFVNGTAAHAVRVSLIGWATFQRAGRGSRGGVNHLRSFRRSGRGKRLRLHPLG
jgi:hypothetical protein